MLAARDVHASAQVLRHDIGEKKKVGTISEAYPHLVIDNFTSKLGQRVGNILKYLFPCPKARRLLSDPPCYSTRPLSADWQSGVVYTIPAGRMCNVAHPDVHAAKPAACCEAAGSLQCTLIHTHSQELLDACGPCCHV